MQSSLKTRARFFKGFRKYDPSCRRRCHDYHHQLLVDLFALITVVDGTFIFK